eukprot:257419_1
MSSKPVRCPDKLTDDDQYKKVAMTGVMDHHNTIIMGPHKAPKSAHSDDWGSFVYSPLTLENGQTVIANRGWIPRDAIHKYIDTPVQPQNAFYEGIISLQEPCAALLFAIDQKIFKQDNDGIISRTWQFKNGSKSNKKLHKKRHNEYVVIDILNSPTNEREYPYRLRSFEDIFGLCDIESQSKRHLAYAYSLGVFGAICCGVSYLMVKKPNKLKRMAMAQRKLLHTNRVQYH